MKAYSPIEVAISLSLYAYNVSPLERARRVYDHFKGDCAELDELVRIMSDYSGYAATELSYPSAAVYVQQALEECGDAASERVRVSALTGQG